MHNALPHADTDAPISHFSNCHTGIFAQLTRLGDLPALLGPAAQARKIAQTSLDFFNDALFNHHSEEEKDLFPAVHSSAQAGAERLKVDTLVEQLTNDHRALENLWKSLEPGLRKVAKARTPRWMCWPLNRWCSDTGPTPSWRSKHFYPWPKRFWGGKTNTWQHWA